METLKLKKLALIIAFTFMVILLPTKILASNTSVAIVNIDGDYAIYIDGLEKSDFKFAFTDDATLDKSNVKEKIDFISSWPDNNGNNIACLEKDNTLNTKESIYLWIDTSSEVYSIQIKQNDLKNAVTKSDMENVEALTSIIDVDTTQTTSTQTVDNGVTTTVTTGQVNIIESNNYNFKDYNYKYQLIKIDGSESETAKELMEIINSLNKDYSGATVYNKILTAKRVIELYNSLKENAVWTDVKDYVIHQPSDSVNGDQYIVLLQQLSGNKVVREDIQFLTCTEGSNQEVVKENNVIKKATALPVTYDSIILFVVLGIIVIIAIAVIIRMKKLKSNNNE